MGKSIPHLNNTKKEQIRMMFFTLKIIALLFSAIPLFQYLSKKYHLNFDINIIGYANLLTFAAICMLIFFLMFLFNRNVNNHFFQVLEITIIMCISIISIFVSGANESYNNFIFLFIIISYTIEYGMATGITIASISSFVILAMNIIYGGYNNGLNKHFEDDLSLFTTFFLVTWTLGYYVKLEKSHIQDLTDYANIDGLTGAYNHRYFYELIDSLYDDSVKHHKQLSLLILDIDYFKKYNDIYGHAKGDELLKDITAIIQKTLRPNDILCRYGGDEFCIILPDTNKDQAIKIANTLREDVYKYDCLGQEYLPNGNLTISVGVSTLSTDFDNCKSFIENADMALYRAKFLRRNKVEVYSSVFDQFKELDNKNTDLLENIKPLKTLITVINSRDTYTFKHVERVFNYCGIVADYLSLPSTDKKHLLYAAYLHDLGKINVPKEILVADNKLTNEQWDELKKHPQDSADIIKQIDGFSEVVPIVLQHHEKYNGTGYPNGLSGENICYLARILTVVDSFDAMTNQRTYQKVKTFDEAFLEIQRCKGTQFDPEIADKFIEAILFYNSDERC